MLLVVGDEAGSAPFVLTAIVKLRVDSRFLYYLLLRYLLSYAAAISLSFADHRPFLVSGQYAAHVSFFCLSSARCLFFTFSHLASSIRRSESLRGFYFAHRPCRSQSKNTEHARWLLRNEASIDTKQTESHAPVHWRLGNISLYLACSWRMGL